MILSNNKTVLEHLGIKKKECPDPLQVCFRCWLKLPESIYKAASEEQDDIAKDRNPCAMCSKELGFEDYGDWMVGLSANYYHKLVEKMSKEIHNGI